VIAQCPQKRVNFCGATLGHMLRSRHTVLRNLLLADCVVVSCGAAVVLVLDFGWLGQSQALCSRGEPEGIRGCCVCTKCGRDEQASEHVIRRPYYYPDRLRSGRKEIQMRSWRWWQGPVGPSRPLAQQLHQGCASEPAAGGS